LPAERTTCKEYDEIVKKYEEMPIHLAARRPRERNALEREYAQVSVEILNLPGKYSNCRLNMMIRLDHRRSCRHCLSRCILFSAADGIRGRFSDVLRLLLFLRADRGGMIIIGMSDYLGRRAISSPHP
jgi:hypothetical protein